MNSKNETEVVEYSRDKKIADPNSLVLDGDSEIETPLPTEQESLPQEPIETEKFCWNRDRDCIVVDHQPTIAIYWNKNDGITLRQEDFYGSAIVSSTSDLSLPRESCRRFWPSQRGPDERRGASV
jgi:hypothetical protein